MKTIWKLTLTVCLVAMLLVAGYIRYEAQTRQNQLEQQAQPAGIPNEQNPFETFDKILSSIQREQGGASARDRCLAKQKSRLRSCETERGQARVVCEAVAKELISVCEEMNATAPAYLASRLFCSGICAQQSAKGCIGHVCAGKNQVCDPGVLWDCNCTTHVIGPPLTHDTYCSCSCG